MSNDILSEKDQRAVEDILIDKLAVTREQLTPESRIMEDLGADSLHLMEILIEVEDQFDVSFPTEQGSEVATVGDVFKTLAENLPRPR